MCYVEIRESIVSSSEARAFFSGLNVPCMPLACRILVDPHLEIGRDATSWVAMVHCSKGFYFHFFNGLCYEAWVFLGLMSSDNPKGITALCEVCISYVLPPSVKKLTMR